jgi:uncharacterized protein YfdQ (DUF2303 family)
MDKETAIKKIQKCIALANQVSLMRPLRIAPGTKLIEQFGVEHPELMAAVYRRIGAKVHQAKHRHSMKSICQYGL